jgi:hypothetical protein
MSFLVKADNDVIPARTMYMQGGGDSVTLDEDMESRDCSLIQQQERFHER